jgi:hypothetical protein
MPWETISRAADVLGILSVVIVAFRWAKALICAQKKLSNVAFVACNV